MRRHWWRNLIFIALLTRFLASTEPALAHEGLPLAPHDLWLAWNLDPLILTGLTLVGWGYLRGVRGLWRRAGVGRGTPLWRVAAFTGGLLALLVALISPLDALSGVLFSAHMVQHLLLMLVAAPLFILGAPPVSLAWSLPQASRRPLAQWWHRQKRLRAGWPRFSRPAAVWVLHAGTIWLWHMPAFYQAALGSRFLHALEHAAFFGTALLFWWTLAQCSRAGRMGYGIGILYIFTMALQGGLLGSLLTFSNRVWYPAYNDSTAAWGFAPLADQQLAGAIMWVPANVVYLLTALLLLGVWLQSMERRDRLDNHAGQTTEV